MQSLDNIYMFVVHVIKGHFTKEITGKMTILWSFSYNFFVKFPGEKTLEQKHDCDIQILAIMRCVIK